MSSNRTDATLPHIAPALVLSGVAITLTVLWFVGGPRQGLLVPMHATLIVGLAVFVVNAIYVVFRFGNPVRSSQNRRIWLLATTAGLPFFLLFVAALSAIGVTTINVTNATDTALEGLLVTYPFSQTKTFDIDPGETHTVRIAPGNEGDAVLTGGGIAEQSAFILECCPGTVDFVIE